MRKIVLALLLCLSTPAMATWLQCGRSVTCTPTSRNDYCRMTGDLESSLFTRPELTPNRGEAYYGLIQTVIKDNNVAYCWYSNHKTGADKIEFSVRSLPKYITIHQATRVSGEWKGDDTYRYCEHTGICLMQGNP